MDCIVCVLSADRCVKGCYAISVTGRLPQGIINELRSKGVPYRSRDISTR